MFFGGQRSSSREASLQKQQTMRFYVLYMALERSSNCEDPPGV
jgi:hypothetical protein